jgi:hypothetical protein
MVAQVRNIAGINGSLEAEQHNTETPLLQVANLHGDIVATMPDSEAAAKLNSAIETTEYGAPSVLNPPHTRGSVPMRCAPNYPLA